MKKILLLGLLLFISLSYTEAVKGAFLNTSTSGDLIFEIIEGHGATSTLEFGLGTPDVNSTIYQRNVIFTINLVDENVASVYPSRIVNMGYFPAGSGLDFYNLSNYSGTHWAFSSNLDSEPTPSDLVVFRDTDNSLGYGGTVIETISVDNWILHLDCAASICCDDDDNEMIIRVRVGNVDNGENPIPEPSTVLLLMLGLMIMSGYSGVRLLRRHNLN